MNFLRAGFFRCFILFALAAALPGRSYSQPAVSAAEDVIAQAREAYNDHLFRESADLYQKYLRLYPAGPDREEAGFFHGQCLFLIHDFKKADAVLARQEGVNRAYADQILYYRAEIASVLKDYSQALIFFERLLGEYPESRMAARARTRRSELHYRLANQYYGKAAYSLALQHYLQADEPRAELKPIILYKIGITYHRLGQDDKAIQTLGDLSLSTGPLDVEAARLARYRVARLFEDAGRYSDAEVNFKELIDSSPGHYLENLAREGLARAWAQQGRIDEAIAYWKGRGKSKELIDFSRKFDKAVMHYLHREYVDADRELTGLLAAATDQELLWKSRLWLARVYTREERTGKALAMWKELFQSPDRVRDFLRVEAARFLVEVDPPEAVAKLNRLHDPAAYAEDAAGLKALALFASADRNAGPAADTYLVRYGDGRYAGELALLRGRLRLARSNLSGAESDFKLAFARHPSPEGRLEAAVYLARVYRLQGRLDSAAAAIGEAAETSARIPSAHDRLMREDARIAYARGDYERGLTAYRSLCPADDAKPSCSADDLFELFWGCYRSGQSEDAEAALQRFAAAGGEAAASKAAMWRSIASLEKGDPQGAFTALKEMQPADGFERGLQGWLAARTQADAGAGGEAIETLSRLDEAAPEAGLFTRGAILSLALESGDFEQYLSALPDPAVQDREVLSQEALLEALRNRSRAGARPSELEAINRILQVEAAGEDIMAEGTLVVARSGLYGSGRAEALSMLDGILANDPGTRFAAEIKLYRGEDAFFRKDYSSAATWLKDVEPEDLSEDLRFRLLYLTGMAFKHLRKLEDMRPHFLALVRDYRDAESTAVEWVDVGVGLIQAREFSAARTSLDLAIAKTDDRKLIAEAYYWKGLVEAGTGNEDAALSAFLAVGNDYRDQGMWAATALYEAAGIYARQDEIDLALDLYKKVKSMSKGDKKRIKKINEKIGELRKKKLKKTLNP